MDGFDFFTESGPSRKDDNVLSVSQLTGLIKTMLEGSFPSIVVKGEISNFKPSASGHMYFSLKDNDAQISAVMFRGAAAALNFVPKDGKLVQCKGKITVYPPRGNYQIQISSMSLAGTGDIMEMIEERKRKLSAEGLFDSSRKRRLPFFPSTVGIVTSPNGAALRDILNIRNRRNDKIDVVVLPALVQGATAAPTIVSMIKAANEKKLCDVLIVGRGGGSLEDLLPFSEESVVRAVAGSEIPVVSAVGHEIDFALCDFAADVRAPTPSAAAEIVFPEKKSILEDIGWFRNELASGMGNRISSLRLVLRAFDRENMKTQLENIEQKFSERFDAAYDQLVSSMQEIIREKRHEVELCRNTLENCSPQNIFDRGYSMVTGENGKIIRKSTDVSENMKIIITPSEGRIEAVVSSVK